MSAPGPEQNPGTGNNPEFEAAKAELARQSAAQLLKEMQDLKAQADEVKNYIDGTVMQERRAPATLGDNPKDKQTIRGKAADVNKTVQKVLWAAKTAPDKLPAPENKPPDVTSLSNTVINKLADRINIASEVSEVTAPYLHQIINGTLSGQIANVEDLAKVFDGARFLQAVSPELFRKVQSALVETAKEKGYGEAEAKTKFKVEERPDEVVSREAMDRQAFDRMWQEHYSSYFDNTDRPFVESLYSPVKFVQFVDDLKQKTGDAMGMDRSSEEVAKAVSKEIERKTVELFGKLYTRLDHEKPSEFFHEIEQQDIMRGILPVKNELKRRMTLLSTEIERAEEEGIIKDPGLYQRVELKANIEDMSAKAKDGTHVKPRYRIVPFTQPRGTEASHFIHYLDQIVDQYVEARKYTHNARAIFLHPVDAEKGFYSQLAQFANDMSTVDFDQMMALPDNEVFRDAFSMYDKMVEETFASNDWRHFPSMFELKQNSVHTQVEEDVLGQLKKMYKNRTDITDARLEAALSMAVGASRGMFLNEIEKAAFADPHLTETGAPTFASYYNQDASALIAFNPMHQYYRWQGTNTIDPILFLPVENMKSNKTFQGSHRELWAKMQAYKDSFVNGRKPGIDGETLFADYVVNIGNVGGPLKRKGWRTTYMLEPMYLKEEKSTKFLKFDYFKTWQRFENIGYEVAQDFVAKLPADFASAYEGKHNVDADYLRQKNDLLSYLYGKYFGQDPAGVEGYMKGLRKDAEKSLIARIKQGKVSPPDIRAQVEADATNTFLYRTLARMVAERIPSKLLRIDRDRLSEKGVSRWRDIAEKMFPKDSLPPGQSQSDMFDALMKDLLLGEQLLRKDVSAKMKLLNVEEKDSYRLGSIEYKLTDQKIDELMRDKFPDDPARIGQIKELLHHIQAGYSQNEKFLDGEFTDMLKNGKYKFSFALDEVDMSFVPFRGAGARVLPRAIGDISAIEKNVAAEVIKFPKILQQVAVDGKHDPGPILEVLTKVYGALDGIIGTDYAHQTVHHLAAMAINYFKKDTRARWFGGVFGAGRLNSLAAERAGRGTVVWEWDSRQIDNFCVALETRALLPKQSYSPVNTSPAKEPVYITIPGIEKPIKLPEKMKIFGKEVDLFTKNKPDFLWTSKDLRNQFGGNWKDMAFDTLVNFLPLVMALIIWKYIKEANKEAESGGKKK